jgi:hypothetical protein
MFRECAVATLAWGIAVMFRECAVATLAWGIAVMCILPHDFQYPSASHPENAYYSIVGTGTSNPEGTVAFITNLRNQIIASVKSPPIIIKINMCVHCFAQTSK